MLGVVACQFRPIDAEITLVSIPPLRTAYGQIIPEFSKHWEAKTGERIKFVQSYGPSGAQTRSVLDGLEADVVHLAIEVDMQKLIDQGLVTHPLPLASPIQSVIALAYRAGNPKQIKDWQDLSQSGLQIIAANPKTSGAARWSFVALFGASQSLALAPQTFLRQVYGNTQILARDAREASAVFFKKRQGDVLINYENEMILAQQQGEGGDYVVPQGVNLAVSMPVAVVDAYSDKHGRSAAAKAFVDYLFTPPAQRAFAQAGLRPTDREVLAEFAAQFPPIDRLLTIGDFGGWKQALKEFFAEGGLFDQVQPDRGQ